MCCAAGVCRLGGTWGRCRRRRGGSRERGSSRNEPSATVHVSGLPVATAEGEVAVLLQPWAAVQHVRMLAGRDGTAAAVQLAGVDAARTLMDAANRQPLHLDGQRLYLEYARSDGVQSDGASLSASSVMSRVDWCALRSAHQLTTLSLPFPPHRAHGRRVFSCTDVTVCRDACVVTTRAQAVLAVPRGELRAAPRVLPVRRSQNQCVHPGATGGLLGNPPRHTQVCSRRAVARVARKRGRRGSRVQAWIGGAYRGLPAGRQSGHT